MPQFDGRVLSGILDNELRRRGVSDDSARHVAASLIEASVRGVDSHGINLFPYYVSAVEGGRINRAPALCVLTRRPALATLDADHGFGHHAGSVAMQLAMDMADQTGVGVVGVRRSTHFGAAAYFAHQASRRGYAAFSFTNADALVKAYGAGEAIFGTNPVCFSVPMEGEEPFCLDMATSHVSWNKVMNKRRRGEQMPAGWACDARGEPTTDPDQARMLEPSGEYKGYGLGMMVEILCAGFMDGPFGKDILPMYGSPLTERRSISHFFMAISIRDFTDLDRFRQRIRSLANRIRTLSRQSSQLSQGAAPVMIPGDPEKRTFELRTREGIPMDDATYAEFLGLSKDFAKARLT
jgi:LDH2 family malate/lactate/ureidoglycolate dehydrogenase